MELPFDRPRPQAMSHRGDVASIVISSQQTAALRALGKEHGCSLFMTTLTIFQSLLAIECGQRDIVVGCPVNVRKHESTRQLIGFFVNMVVLRCDFRLVAHPAAIHG
jgi:non-ribosomal peptide synthetase component F